MSEQTRRKALIIGINGQDGSYLAEFLLSKNYEVHGIIRRSSYFNTARIEHLYHDKFQFQGGISLHYGDVLDTPGLIATFSKVKPDEIYNLAAQSHVKVSFDLAEYTSNATGIGLLRVLEAVKAADLTKTCKIYQASSSEMFGDSKADTVETLQNEDSPISPCSPYGAAKAYAHWICRIYKEAFNMFIVSGILFNHESPRRGENFVSRKITRAVARIYLKKQQFVRLGNLNAMRDWGHARDYVEAMWMMLQNSTPKDFVIATGESYSVRYFVEKCFELINLKITWEGQGEQEVGVDQERVVRVKVDSKYFREKEVPYLRGDSSRALKELGWSPKTNLDSLIQEMLESDIQNLRRDSLENSN